MKKIDTLFNIMERIVMGHLFLRVIKSKEDFVRTFGEKSRCSITGKRKINV